MFRRNPPSVDAIVENFTTTVQRLEEATASHLAARNEAHEQAQELIRTADQHAVEADRAASIAGRVRELLG